MGYYTSFSLTANTPNLSDEDRNRLKDELESMNVFESIELDRGGLSAYAYAKWYDADEDMVLLSKRFPAYVFTLEGDGEESDDRWIHYFADGAMQDANMHFVYDEFDPLLLAPYPAAAERTKYSYQE